MYILEILFAVAFAFLCADVDAKVKQVVKIDGPVHQSVLYKVGCGGSKCKIDTVTIEKSGDLYLTLLKNVHYVERTGDVTGTGFCAIMYYMDVCSKITLDEEEFFINLIANPEFSDATLTVELDNSEISIAKFNDERAWVRFDPQTKENYVQIQSGFLEKQLPYREKQIQVSCHGNCKGLKFELKSIVEGSVNLAMSEDEPVFVSDRGTYNSICESNTPGSKDKCRDEEKEEFSLNSSRVFLTLIPNQKFKDAKAILTGRNILDVDVYRTVPYWRSYVSSDGSHVAVKSIKGPLTQGEYIHLKVSCKYYGFCKNVSIEVIPKETVLIVRAGNNTETTSSGHCPGCDCNGVESCATRFDPKGGHPWTEGYGDYFFITLELQPGEDHNLGYVKVYGDNVDKVDDAYLPYDEQSSIH